MPEDIKQNEVRRVFQACCLANSSEEMDGILKSGCQGDAELCRAVLQLLDADRKKQAFLEASPNSLLRDFGEDNVDVTRATPSDDAIVGATIHGYKILQQIGEGGFGVVYMAQQTKPIRRKVALKIIKPGMDSKEVVARFEAERQALVMMDHPNVAKVLDAGTTDTRRPYFVMEIVFGTSITEFCDDNRLSNRERLSLFVDVCQAVQHAHLKAIIHRDLKPSNVLVTMSGDKPLPKVIDFGVSKALSQPLTDKTIFTAFGQMIGTPLYMSPEQAQLSAHDVDVRSDVYSLGVLLYELLTGDTPFDRESLKQSGLDEMRRIIREVEPPRPSARISTLQAHILSTVSDLRRADTRKLSQSLRGELDWIVMKALEKDRERRYESANAFAADVRRYLNDAPVEACPPSVTYRLKKYAKKHKALLTTAALLIAMLVTSTAVSAVFAFQANAARAESVQSEQTAKDAQAAAESEKEKAVAAQKRSDENFTSALAAIDKLLEHASSNELGEIPRAQPIRKEMMDDILKFHRQFVTNVGDSIELRFRAGSTWYVIARLADEMGEKQKAQEAFDTSLEFIDGVVTESPRNWKYLSAQIQTRMQKAWNLYHQGEFASSQAILTQLQKQIADLMASDFVSGNEGDISSQLNSFQIEATRILANCALQLGNENEHQKQLRRAYELSQEYPERVSLGLQRGLEQQMAKLLVGDDRNRAGKHFARAIELSRESLAKDPDRENRVFLAMNLYRAAAFHQSESLQRSRDYCSESMQILGQLRTDFPSIQPYEYHLRGALRIELEIMEAEGSDNEEIVQHLSQYLEQFPTLTMVHDTLAERLSGTETAIEDLGKFINKFPDVAVYREVRASRYALKKEAELALADLEKAAELGVENTLELLVTRANLLNDLHRWPEAEELFDEAIQLTIQQGGDASSMQSAHAAFLLNHAGDPITALSKAVEKYPDESHYYRCRGVAYSRRGEFERAIADADRAIELAEDGKRFDALFARALMHVANGDDVSAIADYNQILEVERPQWDDIQRRGACYFRIGKFDKALADLREGIRRLPHDVWKLLDVPPHDIAACQNEEYRKGYLQLVDDVVEENDESTDSLVARAAIKAAFEDFGQANQDLGVVIDRNDTNYYAHYQAALLFLNLGARDRYKMTCQKMLDAPFASIKNENGKETHFTAWACALAPNALDDYKPAIQLARHAVEKEPDRQQSLAGLGAVLLRAGEYEEAKKQLEKAREAKESTNTSPSYIHYFLAMTEHHLGNADAATEHLNRANDSADAELAGSPVWNRKLTLELLRNEAETLISPEPTERDDAGNHSP